MKSDKKINYQILIRGDTRAYTKEQVKDKFLDRLYDTMEYGFGLDGNYDGKIVTADESTNDPCIGYFDKGKYERVRKRVAWKLTETHMKDQFVELNERVKVYERSIQALESAKLGIFGDKDQVNSVLTNLILQKNGINDIINGAKRTFDRCNKQVFEEYKFDGLPENMKQDALYRADIVIKMFEYVFILDSPENL